MVTWGGNETLLFDKTQAPVQIGKNANRSSGGRRKQTKRKRIAYRGQSRRLVIRSNLSYGRTRKR